MSADKGVARGIILLCQTCGGDLVSVGQSTDSEPRFDCQACGDRWVYTEHGWELVRVTRRR
jgi:DNA-directed RNA polymerase subunit RPC12/RpoP